MRDILGYSPSPLTFYPKRHESLREREKERALFDGRFNNTIHPAADNSVNRP